MPLEEAGLQLIAQNVNVYLGDMGKADNATEGFYKTLGNAGPAANGFQTVITGALRQVGAVMIDFAVQGAKAIGGFVKDSIGLAGDFEAGMLTFQSAAGAGVDTKGLEDFRDLFLQIGKELPVSTSEVQQAATEMVKGGIDPATIAAGGLRQNIQFAAAAMDGDLVKAAEISSKIMGGWTSQTDSAADKAAFLTNATDLLAKAANASSTDVEGLSLGIFNAQGIAKTAGVGFQDLTTTLAALAPRFASSSEAGNSLKNMIARLQPTTDPAISAMEGLGLYTEETGTAFYDAQGNFVGFEKAAQLLQDSLKGLTKEQQAATLQQIFGNDAMGSAAALAELGASGYQSMADALANANGVQEAAALKQQGFNTALDNAKGSVEALQITIGTALLPVLTDLFNNVIAPAVNTLTDMADALFGNDEAFNRLSPSAQGLVTIIGILVADVQEIIGVFNDAGAGSSEFASRIGDLASDLGLPGELISDIVSAVQDLVGWFSTANSETSSLSRAVDDLNGVWVLAGKVVGDAMAGYQAIANAVLPQIAAFIDAHGEEIDTFFTTTWDSVIDIVTLALQLYDSIVPPILQAVAGFISDHGEEIQKIFGGVWQVITSLITGALETIKGVFQLALDIVHGDWEAAWGDIQGIVDAQITGIQGAIGGFLNMITGIFNTSMADIGKVWQNNWNMMVEIANKVGGRMIEAGSNIVGGIVEGIKDNASAIYDVLSDIADGAVNAFLKAIGAGSPAVEFMPAGQYALQGVMAGMESMLPALMGLITETGTNMIAALRKNVSKGGDAIRKMMDDLTSDIKDISSQINDAIADGFGATASIDRQIAKNLDKFKDIPDQYRQYTEGALKEAQLQAAEFADPAQGAKFFKMRSDQILEYAGLQGELADAQKALDDAFTTQADPAATMAEQEAALAAQRAATADIARLQQQMLLINKAQSVELQQWDVTQRGRTTPQEDIASQIAALFQSNDVARNLPGVLQNAIVAQLTSLLGQLQTPAASPRTPYNGGPTTTTNTTNLNMPIYTNNSPSALQSSMAIANAAII